MDCQLIASALKRFRQQLTVESCVVSRKEILQAFSRRNIDVALIDLDLEDRPLSGLQVLPELHVSYPTTPVIILFDTWQDDLVVHAFRAGAKGVFSRSETNFDVLRRCIDAVHRGQVWASSRQLVLLLIL